MKKLFTIALCFAAVGTMSAQKSVVDQAQKLAGKADKVAEARALIEQAKNNPETSGDVQTYYVAGKIEFDAYDNALKKQMINPNDESVNPLEMAGQLVNGYKEFAKALPLDSVPDAKGKAVKTNKIEEESPNLLDLILGHQIDLVIDTPSQGKTKSHDGFLIRRNAIETGVNVLTSLDTANALISSLEHAMEQRLELVDIASIDLQ